MTHARPRSLTSYFNITICRKKLQPLSSWCSHRGRNRRDTLVIWDAHTKYRLKTDRHDPRRSLHTDNPHVVRKRDHNCTWAEIKIPLQASLQAADYFDNECAAQPRAAKLGAQGAKLAAGTADRLANSPTGAPEQLRAIGPTLQKLQSGSPSQ